MARADWETTRSKKKNKRMAPKGRSKAADDRSGMLKSLSSVAGLDDGKSLFGGCDPVVLILVILITLFGVAMVFSAGFSSTVGTNRGTAFFLIRQGRWALIGFAVLFVSSRIDYHIYSRWGNVSMVVSLTLLILIFVLGASSHGATRWLFGITPSDVTKLCMIIYTSSYLAIHPEGARNKEGLITLTAVMAFHFILIMAQPNLSTAIVVVAIMLGIMIVGGLDLRWLSVPIALGAIGTFMILNVDALKESHWYGRITTFTDPFGNMQGDGYQVSQGLIALGNGGLTGLGFGKSVSKYMYLPEAHNDFILAIIGEELGFIGFLLLMALYLVLLFKLILIALRARDSLGFYLATGVAVLLGLQLIINVAVVTSSMPATGITLPFISYGGTSMVIFMFATGISLNISKTEKDGRRLL